jgi:hypothetical protein
LNPGIGGPGDPDSWSVVVRGQNISCVVGPESTGTAIETHTLAISPTRDLAHRPSTTVAINAENIPDHIFGEIGTDADPYLVRIYPDDVARFVLTPNGIRLPAWAERRKLAEE